ncbi:alternative ribosome rescue aminoacyl-tRNA hydrolase ArfB [Methylopila sp. M107]|uniref:alternative ribosome rescue aminoacyl-tRNA hydrolase ArfB n=1 Tax=Methylopila sp. M107 TaxID=1101190 RepID=UPI000360F60C|nr:alternative ribosome rescue aminoacyl-tRNA hydrolase ArfB [Methylopila sp. M107]
MIRITDTLFLDEEEIDITFVRSSGPGGQNVNKVSTAAKLRFDARRSPSLPNDVAIRLMRIAGARLTKEGVIVLTAQSNRTQGDNREEAVDRLVAMIREATERPKPRIETRVSKGAKARRTDAKTRRGATKSLRGPIRAD